MSAPTAGTAVSWAPGRLCGVFAEYGPQLCEDRTQSKNDARPGGIAARFDYGVAVPRRNGFKSELAGLTDCWLLMTGRPSSGAA